MPETAVNQRVTAVSGKKAFPASVSLTINAPFLGLWCTFLVWSAITEKIAWKVINEGEIFLAEESGYKCFFL